MIETILVIVVVSLVGLVSAKNIWQHYFRKCKECSGKIKMDSHKDPLGFNVSKNMTFSFWQGPRRYTEIWKCQSCGDEEHVKRWGI